MGATSSKLDEDRRPCMPARMIDVRASTEPKSTDPVDIEDANLMMFPIPDDGEILKLEIADIIVHVDKNCVMLDTSRIVY